MGIVPRRTAVSAATALAATAVLLAVLAIAGLLTGQIAVMQVTSGSMTPAIAEGDLIVATRVPATEIQTGDIVTVRDGDRLLTHRVDEVAAAGGDSRELVLKGDANDTRDARTYVVDQVPRTAWVITSGGRLLDAISAPPAPQLFLGAALCAVVFIASRPLTGRRPQYTGEPADVDIDRPGDEPGPAGDMTVTHLDPEPEESPMDQPDRSAELSREARALQHAAEELAQTPGFSEALEEVRQSAQSPATTGGKEDVLYVARDVPDPEWALVGARAKAAGLGGPGRHAAAAPADQRPTGRRRAEGEPSTGPVGRKGRHAS